MNPSGCAPEATGGPELRALRGEPLNDPETLLAQHPEARHVLALAREWAAVATGKSTVGASETLRFAAVWIGFNALYSLASNRGNESERVGQFAGRADVEHLHAHLLRTDHEYAEAVAALAERPIFNHWTRKNVAIVERTSSRQVLEVCYAIRGNLVHGHKSPQVARDLHLVGAAYRVILPIVTHFADASSFFAPQPQQGP